jgi:hypothetical protein
VLGPARFHVQYNKTDARARLYYLEDVWVETSLSTKEANESTTSSGGLPALVSSPGLYFPVFTAQRGGDQPEGVIDGWIERTQYPPQSELYSTFPQISLRVVPDDRNSPARLSIVRKIKAGDYELKERPGRLSDHSRFHVCRTLERRDERSRAERELVWTAAHVLRLVRRDQRGSFRAGVRPLSFENPEGRGENIIAEVRRRQADDNTVVAFVLG